MERSRRGIDGLARYERGLGIPCWPRRELNQLELAALSHVTGDWKRPIAAQPEEEAKAADEEARVKGLSNDEGLLDTDDR